MTDMFNWQSVVRKVGPLAATAGGAFAVAHETDNRTAMWTIIAGVIGALGHRTIARIDMQAWTHESIAKDLTAAQALHAADMAALNGRLQAQDDRLRELEGMLADLKGRGQLSRSTDTGNGSTPPDDPADPK